MSMLDPEMLKFMRLVSFVSELSGKLSDQQITTVWELLPFKARQIPNGEMNNFLYCLAHGRKIEAIKWHRQFTGLGLKESKDAIENFYSEWYRDKEIRKHEASNGSQMAQIES